MHELLSATSADRYAEPMRETVDRIAGRLATPPNRSPAPAATQLQDLVDAVDLDGRRLGTATALREADDLSASTRSGSTTPPTRRT